MSKRTFADVEVVLREMDPAPILTDDERHRAAATRDRILSTPGVEHVPTGAERKKRHRGRALVAAAIAATAAVGVPTVIGGGSAFASWTATPQPLSRSNAAAAATTCQSALGIDDQRARVVMSEKRGGWTYVLLESPAGEAACLMPEDLIGSTDSGARKKGFFGTFVTDAPEAPALAPDAIDEDVSMGGSVSLPGRLPFTSTDGWFTWVTGYVGSDVTGVTVHPPVGPDVEATVSQGRFSAWWPAGEARGDNPGVSGAWSYTVTLADGTSRPGA
ncbi:hypothetical protein [Aeromicrobium wangtongii]|uniref:hypothetical protein n=1 Tax=Aeromicrobium wangtongii TaxID=2969247 RepID=UPI0020177027|nr:hypothetical protein [Aeromicrobium wangtongii]MCL3816978.1 hypothetical protein [Aeromicrobium wangtongii]